ncbi:MAG TPA: methyltransferase domain-containing protein [Leptolinea sp.]
MTFPVNLHRRFCEQAAWTQQAQKMMVQSAGIYPESRILEVGCGTGAFLSSIQSILNANYFGVDIQMDLLQFASEQSPDYLFSVADGQSIPFRNGSFDGVVCHFFLMWVKNPLSILLEMRRVVRSGGVVAVIAEPDYGSRIEYPPEFIIPGKLQREALIKQGANPDIGRQLSELLGKSGCKKIATGVLGSFQDETSELKTIAAEQEILTSDLIGLMNEQDIQTLLQKDKIAHMNNSRVQFVPTFFGWGFNP